MLNKKVLIFSHISDVDGAGSVILASLAFSNVKVCLCRPDNFLKHIRKYKREILKADYVFTTDLVFCEKEINLLDELNSKGHIFLFDHHQTSVGTWLEGRPWANVVIKDDEGSQCGTKLFYQFLIATNALKQSRLLDDFVEKVRREDTWDWKKLNDLVAHNLASLFTQVGIKKYIQMLTKRFKEQLAKDAATEFKFLATEQKIIDKHNKERLEKIENCLSKMILVKEKILKNKDLLIKAIEGIWGTEVTDLSVINAKMIKEISLLFSQANTPQYVKMLSGFVKKQIEVNNKTKFRFLDDEQKLVDKKNKDTQMNMEKCFKKLIPIKLFGKNVVICFMDKRFRNDFSEYLRNKNYDAEYILMATSEGSVSARNIKEDADVRKVAEYFGGGGHTKAAGFQLKARGQKAILKKMKEFEEANLDYQR